MSALDLHDQTVVGRTLVIGGADAQFADKIYRCTLDRCVVDFRKSGWRGFIFTHNVFRDCEIRVRRPMKNIRWDAVFDSCRFVGQFFGCDFGPHPFELARQAERGDAFRPTIAGGSFVRARLRLCRFFETNVDAIQWPGWPTVLVVDPRAPEHAARLRELAASPDNTLDSRIILELLAGKDEEESFGRNISAVALDAELQKEPWPEAVWRRLIALPFVRAR
jgi:hypothetical protein